MESVGQILISWGKAAYTALKPSFLSKNPHFKFLTVHYFLIVGMSILGSIIIFGSQRGSLAYIDALFFATGANTQAGLNTVDFSAVNTFGQVVITLMCMVTNPVAVNTFVVWLRLYWFEKRFQHVAAEARLRRSTMSRSKSKANALDVERGVGGRNIQVMHGTANASRVLNDGTFLENYSLGGAMKSHGGTSTAVETDEENIAPTQQEGHVKFSDQVPKTKGGTMENGEGQVRLPGLRTNAEHIAILERQRQDDKRVLRIPGPRDVEQGVGPEEFGEEESNNVGMTADRGPYHRRQKSSVDSPPYRPDHDSGVPPSNNLTADRPQTITIAEPARPKRSEGTGLIDPNQHAHQSGLKFRGPRASGDGHRADHDEHSRNPLHKLRSALSSHKDDPMPYLSWQPTIGRNSDFLALSDEQREELGGIEYRSLKTLAAVLALYYWGFMIFGVICLLPWILVNNPFYRNVVESVPQNATWWGFFTAGSAFMDLGFTLTPDSMISFASARFPLLITSFLIVIGNTGFPIMLRFMIWLGHIFVPRECGLWEELRFLLDHPRRCFTLMFPSIATWYLFGILVLLNMVDLIFYVVLDLGSGPVAETPRDIQFLDGWFQAASTRTAGFAVVNMDSLHPAVKTSYLIMMYISIFPIAISVRRTNVYEERALGVYNDDPEIDDNGGASKTSYVGSHLRRQLSFDLWYIFIGFFILTISEGKRLMNNDISMFSVLFEVVSAYGTVGLSLGYPNTNQSLCAQFSVVGKLVIVAMMIRGRHRGLPYALDRAILLPSEALDRKEAEEAEMRLQRRFSGLELGRANSTATRVTTRGRSRSIDRRNVITQFLHPGPQYSGPSNYVPPRMDPGPGMSGDTTIGRTTSDLVNDYNDELAKAKERRPSSFMRRASTQPDLHHRGDVE